MQHASHVVSRAQHLSNQRALQLTRQILDEVIKPERAGEVGIRLWDGSLWPDETPRATTLHLKHAGALRAIFLRFLEIQSCEAYLFDDFDIEGRIENLAPFMEGLRDSSDKQTSPLRVLAMMLRLPPTRESRGDYRTQLRRANRQRTARDLSGERHSEERDSAAIQRHYDVSNEFYALWLDPKMVYSGGYFKSETDSLEDAQTQKLDLVCRKLRLQRGQKLLDIGCGWGALIVHAAKHYGVYATGVTLSPSQAAWARDVVERECLQNQVRVLVQDYRATEGTFDAVSSIEMVEHVGAKNLREYFATAHRVLKDGGVFCVQASTNRKIEWKRVPTFMDRYVFPDGQLIPPWDLMREADAVGFETRDVEDLREHFALTLRHWLRRLEDNREAALQHVDDVTYRVWRLYMAASAFAFDTRNVGMHQLLFSKPDARGRSHQPLTRDDWFA